MVTRHFCEICGETIQEEIGCTNCYVEDGFDPEEEVIFDVFQLIEGEL